MDLLLSSLQTPLVSSADADFPKVRTGHMHSSPGQQFQFRPLLFRSIQRRHSNVGQTGTWWRPFRLMIFSYSSPLSNCLIKQLCPQEFMVSQCLVRTVQRSSLCTLFFFTSPACLSSPARSLLWPTFIFLKLVLTFAASLHNLKVFATLPACLLVCLLACMSVCVCAWDLCNTHTHTP